MFVRHLLEPMAYLGALCMPKRYMHVYRQLRVNDLSKVLTWRMHGVGLKPATLRKAPIRTVHWAPTPTSHYATVSPLPQCFWPPVSHLPHSYTISALYTTLFFHLFGSAPFLMHPLLCRPLLSSSSSSSFLSVSSTCILSAIVLFYFRPYPFYSHPLPSTWM